VLVRDAFATLPVQAVVDADAVRGVLPVARVLGPAALAYVSSGEFRPVPSGVLTVEQLPGGHPDLRQLEKLAGDDDAGEAGLDEITSPAFVVREAGEVVAAAGQGTGPGDGFSDDRACPRGRAAAAVAGPGARVPSGRCRSGLPGTGCATEHRARVAEGALSGAAGARTAPDKSPQFTMAVLLGKRSGSHQLARRITSVVFTRRRLVGGPGWRPGGRSWCRSR
jgi:hypothetical protein